MSGTNYAILYQYTDTKEPRLWSRRKIQMADEVWIPHLDIFGKITSIYLRWHGDWVIRVVTEDGQLSNYINVVWRDIPGRDMQPRKQNTNAST
jgi:hypothetical protein